MTENTYEPLDWIDEIVSLIEMKDKKQYIVSSGKSPSGPIHIGFMRELILSDVISRELENRGNDVIRYLVIDDFDPLRTTIRTEDSNIGIPYSEIEDPYGCCESYGKHWTNQLTQVLDMFGIDVIVKFASDMYHGNDMRELIKKCIVNVDYLKEIMIKNIASDFTDDERLKYIESMEDWYPVSVLCPQCHTIQSGKKGDIEPNRVTGYDISKDMISYECKTCISTNVAKFEDVRMKLGWRIDWVAKWVLLNVDFEPAGKDHATKGGSYDTGLEIISGLFEKDGPIPLPFGWVLVDNETQGTSRGKALLPSDWLYVATPELLRYIILKTPPKREIDILTESIPDIMNEFDRIERIFFDVDNVDSNEKAFVKRIYPLCVNRDNEMVYIKRLPFKFAMLMSQISDIIGHNKVVEKCIEHIGIDENYSVDDIEHRLSLAKKWVKEYGKDVHKFNISNDIEISINDNERKFLEGLIDILNDESMTVDDIQNSIFNLSTENGISVKKMFKLMYKILLNKSYGPRLAPLIDIIGRERTIERIRTVI